MDTTAEKSERRFVIQKALSAAADILSVYLPLANAHPVDFLVEDVWNRVLPESIQRELTVLTEEEVHQLLSLSPVSLNPEQQLTVLPNSKKKHHAAEEHFTWTASLDGSSDKPMSGNKMSEHKSCCQPKRPVGKLHGSLTDFLTEVREHCLEHLTWLNDSMNRLNTWLHDGDIDHAVSRNIHFMHAFMNEKKMHEVEIMTELCAQMFSKSSADVVVDVGSGKGYLSTNLSLQCHLPVVGIDSQSHNTSGAVQRADMLVRQWNSLLKHEMKISTKKANENNQNYEKISSADASYTESSASVSPDQIESNIRGNCCDKSSFPSDDSKVSKRISENQIPEACDMTIQEAKESTKAIKISESEMNQQIQSKQVSNSNETEHNNERPSSETDHTITNQKKLPRDRSKPGGKNVALTMFVNPDTKLLDLVEKSADALCPDKPVKDTRLLLTGLHTCGPLASSMLQLFVNEEAVKAMCGVGCCYQLMQERFADESGQWQDPLHFQHSEVRNGDFPLSSVLLDRKMSIGRTALNMASLALPRMSQSDGELQGRTFYPRALLQSFLQQKLGYIPQDLKKLRKLAKQASSPPDYILRALQKLNITGCKATEDEAVEFHKHHCHVQKQMGAFFQLRAALAPLVETVVLLDRLLYLFEQDCVKDAFIVRLFDPVTSPRCYAIVAIKKDANQ